MQMEYIGQFFPALATSPSASWHPDEGVTCPLKCLLRKGKSPLWIHARTTTEQ